MRTVIKHLFFFATACLWFVANPAFFGCAEEEDFAFGGSEMKQFIEGTWTGSMTLNNDTTPFTLVLQQAANPTAGSPLCGSRSFVAEAAACVAVSSMPVLGTLSTDDGRYTDEPVVGSLEVYGARMSNALLNLQTTDHIDFTINSSDGETFDQEGQIFQDGASGRFTLSRAAR